MLKVESSELAIQPQTLFEIGGFPFTNSHASGLLITVISILLAIYVIFMVKKNGRPSKFQSFLEITYEGFLGFITQLSGGNEKVGKKILPIIGTLFLYLGISNIILTLPFLTAIQYNGVTVFRAHTLDFNTTFGIATLMVVMMNIYSLFKLNPIGFFFKYIKINMVFNGFVGGFISGFKEGGIIGGIKQSLSLGLMSFVDVFIGILDIVSEFAKMISWSLRLFGNMYAGELLTGLVMSSFAIAAPVPLILIFGLFSGLVQALVFGALTAANFAMVMEDEPAVAI